jgi:hypothetical protein
MLIPVQHLMLWKLKVNTFLPIFVVSMLLFLWYVAIIKYGDWKYMNLKWSQFACKRHREIQHLALQDVIDWCSYEASSEYRDIYRLSWSSLRLYPPQHTIKGSESASRPRLTPTMTLLIHHANDSLKGYGISFIITTQGGNYYFSEISSVYTKIWKLILLLSSLKWSFYGETGITFFFNFSGDSRVRTRNFFNNALIH